MNTSLVINLAYEPFSFALYENSELLTAIYQRSSRKLSETLTDQIKKSFVENQIPLHTLKNIGVINGPGSYTGLRIGISIAKTMSLALNIPIYSCTALQAIANQVSILNTTYAVVLPSKKEWVYFQLFNQQKPSMAESISDPICITLEHFYKLIDKFNSTFNIFGLLDKNSKDKILKKNTVNFFETNILSTGINTEILKKINTNCSSEFKTVKPFYFHEPKIGIIKKNISRFKTTS